ncbi:MAG: methyltransferase domain-containing protein [Candidatus Dadabacteria bacterium]|nr:methyltransferase domain-containing protein [Candidatus Dadabacteria bacterium]
MNDERFLYETDELEALKHAKNYYNWIISYFRPYIGRSVVEVGAGIGTFTDFIINNTEQPYTLTLYEPATNNFQQLEKKYSGKEHLKLIQGYFEYSGHNKYDTLIVNNVLEHIEDDVSFVEDVNKSLVDSGKLLIFVPALDLLYSNFDESLGHFRRYSKNSLTKLLNNQGFKIIMQRYFNFLGVITWYIFFKILRKKTLSISSIRLYDKFVIPVLEKVERIVEPPVGQNLLVIAEKR